jgi:hypothetical protein
MWQRMPRDPPAGIGNLKLHSLLFGNITGRHGDVSGIRVLKSAVNKVLENVLEFFAVNHLLPAMRVVND